MHYRHFEHSTIVAIATGSIFGSFFEAQVFVNSGRLNSSTWLWNKTSIGPFFMRVLVTVLIVGPLMIFRSLLLHIVFEMREDGSPLESRVATYTVLVEIIPFFTTGFVVFAFLRLISNKM